MRHRGGTNGQNKSKSGHGRADIEETDRFSDKKDYYAWKGYAFKILNELEEKDYIRQGSHPSRSKSVYITPDGLEHARNLLERYHITDREKEDRPKNEKTPL